MKLGLRKLLPGLALWLTLSTIGGGSVSAQTAAEVADSFRVYCNGVRIVPIAEGETRAVCRTDQEVMATLNTQADWDSDRDYSTPPYFAADQVNTSVFKYRYFTAGQKSLGAIPHGHSWQSAWFRIGETIQILDESLIRREPAFESQPPLYRAGKVRVNERSLPGAVGNCSVLRAQTYSVFRDYSYRYDVMLSYRVPKRKLRQARVLIRRARRGHQTSDRQLLAAKTLVRRVKGKGRLATVGHPYMARFASDEPRGLRTFVQLDPTSPRIKRLVRYGAIGVVTVRVQMVDTRGATLYAHASQRVLNLEKCRLGKYLVGSHG